MDPFCHLQGCSCPTGYELDEMDEHKVCHRVQVAASEPNAEQLAQEEDKCMVELEIRNATKIIDIPPPPLACCLCKLVPCDVENDCSPNASCEFIETVYRHKCVCREGFVGDGHECVEQEESCNIVSIGQE